MAGIKGQRKGKIYNPVGANQWAASPEERERVPGSYCFRPRVEVAEAIDSCLEAHNLTRTEFLDFAADLALVLGEKKELFQSAIRDAIAMKRNAIALEKKSKKKDNSLISKWESEISELEELFS